MRLFCVAIAGSVINELISNPFEAASAAANDSANFASIAAFAAFAVASSFNMGCNSFARRAVSSMP